MTKQATKNPHEEQAVWLEQQMAQVQGENGEWIRQNMNRLLAEHPEYWGKFAIIASRCSKPVLAVDEDHDVAYKRALDSKELQQLAAAEKLPPDFFVATMSLADL